MAFGCELTRKVPAVNARIPKERRNGARVCNFECCKVVNLGRGKRSVNEAGTSAITHCVNNHAQESGAAPLTNKEENNKANHRD